MRSTFSESSCARCVMWPWRADKDRMLRISSAEWLASSSASGGSPTSRRIAFEMPLIAEMKGPKPP